MTEKASPETLRTLKERCIYKKRKRLSLNESLKVHSQKRKYVVLKVLRENPPASKSAVSEITGIRRSTFSYKTRWQKNKNRKLWQKELNEITQFYERMDISTLMPNKKKSKDDTPYYIMQMPLQSTYEEFVTSHSNNGIRFMSFVNAKPQHVHLLNVKTDVYKSQITPIPILKNRFPKLVLITNQF